MQEEGGHFWALGVAAPRGGQTGERMPGGARASEQVQAGGEHERSGVGRGNRGVRWWGMSVNFESEMGGKGEKWSR